MTLQRSEILRYAEDYEQFPENRAVILNTLLALLQDAIDDEISTQKLILSPHERAAEASFAILETIESFLAPDGFVWPEDWKSPFEDTFLYFFRRQLKKLRPRKDHVCIEGLSIEDAKPNPEEQYIVKEQMELIRKFLTAYYDPITVDQFMRRFADGEKFCTIAEDYGVPTSSLSWKLEKVKRRVSKYMKRITEFHK